MKKMNENRLSKELKRMYDSAQDKGRALSVHLFGIQYADELEGLNLSYIAESATGHRSYATEIRKGMNLASHVKLKK